VIAHIGGFPVEEAVVALAPVVLMTVGVARATLGARLRRR
jgi:hypothetical protein